MEQNNIEEEGEQLGIGTGPRGVNRGREDSSEYELHEGVMPEHHIEAGFAFHCVT